MATKVMFRKFRGKIIAIFPELAGNMYAWTALAYAHEGQHFTTDISEMIRSSKPAKPSEYASLMKELKVIGYKNLKIVKRSSYADMKKREAQVRRNPDKSKRKNPLTLQGAYQGGPSGYVAVTGPDWKTKKYYLKGVSSDGEKFYFSKYKKDAIKLKKSDVSYVKREINRSRPDLVVLT